MSLNTLTVTPVYLEGSDEEPGLEFLLTKISKAGTAKISTQVSLPLQSDSIEFWERILAQQCPDDFGIVDAFHREIAIYPAVK